VSSPPPIDPLEAVDLLTDQISGANNMPPEISRLTRAIDTLIYSLHTIGRDVPHIEETELESPIFDYREAYEAIKQRYPTLGHYWLALHAIMQDGADGELAVGDAIDDLADIFIALREVRWFNEHVDQRNALAALRARYDMHLWMHLHSLRQYLEEMKHDG
jgi:hypothetical protein